jgi:hypothetical protein
LVSKVTIDNCTIIVDNEPHCIVPVLLTTLASNNDCVDASIINEPVIGKVPIDNLPFDGYTMRLLILPTSIPSGIPSIVNIYADNVTVPIVPPGGDNGPNVSFNHNVPVLSPLLSLINDISSVVHAPLHVTSNRLLMVISLVDDHINGVPTDIGTVITVEPAVASIIIEPPPVDVNAPLTLIVVPDDVNKISPFVDDNAPTILIVVTDVIDKSPFVDVISPTILVDVPDCIVTLPLLILELVLILLTDSINNSISGVNGDNTIDDDTITLLPPSICNLDVICLGFGIVPVVIPPK